MWMHVNGILGSTLTRLTTGLDVGNFKRVANGLNVR